MSYRIKELIEKLKKRLPLYIVLWVFLVGVLVCPLAYSVQVATIDNIFDLNEFFSCYTESINDLFVTIKYSLSSNYILNTSNFILEFSALYIIVITIGTIRNAKNREYRDIEHGSSDWSKGGEQYKTLSNKKGIILAENNYLPLDKRGNTNVLIVGRIRCW